MGKEALNYNSTKYLNETDLGYLPENKELLSKSIILGDQSPWAGGLVRMEVIEGLLGSTTYHIQDADTPWKTDGYSRVLIRRGWSDYWSLANRYPFSFSIPNTRVDNMRQSLGSPDGLAYLIGPKTSATIMSEFNNRSVGLLVNQMLREEAEWATKVAEWMSEPDAIARGKQIQKLFEEDKSLKDVLSSVMSLSISHSHDTSSFIESFREKPVQLVGAIPINNYWVIDKDGRRRELDTKTVLNNGEVLLPKGKAVPLEISARGDVLGFTGLSYLDGVIGMRDKFVPGLKLKFVEIKFNWQLNPNPLEAMWEAFKVKKQLRGQSPQKPINDFERINAYWMNRPTTISYKILGGDLNPELRYREF